MQKQLRITGLLAFRRHSAAPGFRKTPFGRALRRWNALCGVLLHPQFCSPANLQFVYTGYKTVANSRNVMRHILLEDF